MEPKEIINILDKYNISEQDRLVILAMVEEYQKANKKLKNNGVSRVAAWLILKKIWDYLEE